MSFEKVAPGAITLGLRTLGRIDDVGEYDGGEHPVDNRDRTRPGQKLLHLREDPVAGVKKDKMVGPRNLHQSGVRNAGGQFATAFDVDQRVTRQMDDEGRNLYGRKNSGNIDLAIHTH